MLVRMSFTIMMAIFGAGLICFFMFGCGAASPLYVIDAQKLAGAAPATAESLLHEMVPCQLSGGKKDKLMSKTSSANLTRGGIR